MEPDDYELMYELAERPALKLLNDGKIRHEPNGSDYDAYILDNSIHHSVDKG